MHEQALQDGLLPEVRIYGEAMKLYNGEIYRQFIISCLAMDYSPEMVRLVYSERYGRNDLTGELIGSISQQDQAEIRRVREEQLAALVDLSVTARIDAIARELEELMNSADTKADARAYLAAANTLKGYLEMLAKIRNELKEGPSVVIAQQITAQMNYDGLKVMEQDGLITINKEPELKALLGV